MRDYVICIDASVDIDQNFIDENHVVIIPMKYVLGETERLMENRLTDSQLLEFYNAMRSGEMTHTSQITPYYYQQVFRREAEKGHDILYISLSGGLSSTYASALSAAEDIEDEFEGLKIDGKLYGFAPYRGNGCVTYVKKAWMDECGITEAPTTYDAYIEMLKAFTAKYGTYAVAAAGFVGNEAPFVNYLPEFYQDAYPYFIQQEDGSWVDGFTQDNMKAAMQRIQDAVKDGLIDKETLTNTTADARNKFYDDKFGVFTYWAGTWATNLKTNLEANGKDGELIALKPLEGLPAYYDRVPPVWCITSKCSDPQKVFDAFIDTMLDGGDCQMLWTYGVEGVHWSKSAGTVLAGTEKEKTYEDGQFHMLENLEKEGTLYTKNHIDPMLSLASFADGYYDPKEDSVKPEAKAAAELFNENSRLAAIVPATPTLSELNGELTTLKGEIIADIALGNLSVEEGFAKFENEGGLEMSNEIVASLNELNK